MSCMSVEDTSIMRLHTMRTELLGYVGCLVSFDLFSPGQPNVTTATRPKWQNNIEYSEGFVQYNERYSHQSVAKCKHCPSILNALFPALLLCLLPHGAVVTHH